MKLLAPVPKDQWGQVKLGAPVPKDQWGKVRPVSGAQPQEQQQPTPLGGQNVAPQGSAPPQQQGQQEQQGASSEYPEDAEFADVARGVAHGALEAAGGVMSFVPDVYAKLYNDDSLPWPYNQAIGPKHIGSLGNEIEKGINKVVSPPKTAVGNVADTLSNLVASGAAGSVADKLIEEGMTAVGMAKKYTAIEQAVVADARNAGIKLSPKYIGGGLSKAAQTMGGGPRVSQTASIDNIATVDRLAKVQLAGTNLGKALGLDPENMELAGPLNVYKAIRKVGYAKYAKVAQQIGVIPENAETRPLWDDFFKAVRKSGGRHASRLFGPFGKNIPTKLAETKMKYLDPQENLTADELMEEVRNLRQDANANLAVQDAEKNPVGKGQWDIARAIDNLVGGYAELLTSKGVIPPGTFQEYLDTRQSLAITETYAGATAPSGHIISKALAALESDNPDRLTGNLKRISRWAALFPDDFQPMYEKGEQGIFSAVDYLLGGSGIVFNHPAETFLALARPVARKTVLSKPVQDAMAERYAGKVPYLNKGIPIGAGAGLYEESKDDGNDQQ